MKIGLQIPNFTFRGGPAALWAKLGEIARTADEVGFYSLWVMDHFFQSGGPERVFPGPAYEDMLEGYSTLAFLAGMTRMVKLGRMVTGVIYRQPGMLVKTVTTLDVLSGGRAWFGAGAAWFEGEVFGNSHFVEECLQTLALFSAAGYQSMLLYEKFGYPPGL